jgi:hypothetical protein
VFESKQWICSSGEVIPPGFGIREVQPYTPKHYVIMEAHTNRSANPEDEGWKYGRPANKK